MELPQWQATGGGSRTAGHAERRRRACSQGSVGRDPGAAAVAPSPAAASPAAHVHSEPPTPAELESLQSVLDWCAAAGELDRDVAARYRFFFVRKMSAAARATDLEAMLSYQQGHDARKAACCLREALEAEESQRLGSG